MKVNQRSYLTNIVLYFFFYTLLVILWGAWVRISHSGDGCGSSWPTCQGALVPDLTSQKTWTEYAHRVMSGLYGIFSLFLTGYLIKIKGSKHPATKISYVTLFLTLTEALLGAKLVLSGLVSTNSSVERVFVVALHQINSLLLSGSIFWTYLVLKNNDRGAVKLVWRRVQSLVLIVFFFAIATTGSWAALSGSLFPSEGLIHGLQQDFSSNSHVVVRLRILHPLMALLLGGLVLFYLQQQISEKSHEDFKKVNRHTLGVLTFSLLFGISTLFFLSPVWMKLTHLLLVHLLWAQLLTWILASSSTTQAKEIS